MCFCGNWADWIEISEFCGITDLLTESLWESKEVLVLSSRCSLEKDLIIYFIEEDTSHTTQTNNLFLFFYLQFLLLSKGKLLQNQDLKVKFQIFFPSEECLKVIYKCFLSYLRLKIVCKFIKFYQKFLILSKLKVFYFSMKIIANSS